jgi:hypothetical protein
MTIPRSMQTKRGLPVQADDEDDSWAFRQRPYSKRCAVFDV